MLIKLKRQFVGACVIGALLGVQAGTSLAATKPQAIAAPSVSAMDANENLDSQRRPLIRTVDSEGGVAGGSPCPDDATGSCCSGHATAGCDDGDCCGYICANIDPFCCDTQWDSICASYADDVPYCDGCFDGFDSCGIDQDCCEPGFPGCEQSECCDAICQNDPYCCTVFWDTVCVEAANDAPNDVCLPCPGACCHSTGTCAFEAEENCTGGMYLGPNTDCSTDSSGCCFGNGTCADLPRVCCELAGGTILDEACAAPMIVCPAEINIECDGSADPSVTGSATATDDCSTLEAPLYTDSVVIGDLCPQTGTITRTWFVTDADGNTTACDQYINVVDNTPPVIECSRDDVERCFAPGGVPAVNVEIFALATDNCSKASNCCVSHLGTGCETTICQTAVCDFDSFCCGTEWDNICADLAGTFCGNLCGPSSCCEQQEPGVAGCDNAECEAAVCACDSFCCDTTWDDFCAGTGFVNGCGAALLCGDLCDPSEDIVITDNRPEVFPPTCGDDPTVVTFTATDECGNTASCDVEVAVIGAMCCPAVTDTDLKLMITDLDLRQDNEGPGNTKARFDIWNSNEVRFSGTERCIICWDETLISEYGPIANHLVLENLQTDKGKARIQNEGSTVCPESTDAALLGVAIEETRFLGSPSVEMRSAVTLVGMGEQAAHIQYDIINEPEEANDGSFAIGQVPGVGTGPDAVASDDVAVAGGVADNRASTTFKGSLVSWPVIEVKWDAHGSLIQDTFITIVNDNPGQVKIQFYQVNGDAPLDPVFCCDPQELVERAHPGWNWSDYQITLTGDESTYWSVASGLPKGVSPISVLDPGNPNGRPDLDPSNLGGRVIRGFLVGWAVNDDGQEIRWNHLKGHAVVVRYDQATAFDYNPWNFRVVSGVPEGAQSDGNPGNLSLDGVEYDYAPETLLFDFFAAGTSALSHPDAVNFDNDD